MTILCYSISREEEEENHPDAAGGRLAHALSACVIRKKKEGGNDSSGGPSGEDIDGALRLEILIESTKRFGRRRVHIILKCCG